jgi:hypothetical protein
MRLGVRRRPLPGRGSARAERFRRAPRPCPPALPASYAISAAQFKSAAQLGPLDVWPDCAPAPPQRPLPAVLSHVHASLLELLQHAARLAAAEGSSNVYDGSSSMYSGAEQDEADGGSPGADVEPRHMLAALLHSPQHCPALHGALSQALPLACVVDVLLQRVPAPHRTEPVGSAEVRAVGRSRCSALALLACAMPQQLIKCGHITLVWSVRCCVQGSAGSRSGGEAVAAADPLSAAGLSTLRGLDAALQA